MTLSTPMLAAVPLVAGLMGPALVGATPTHQRERQPDRPAAVTHPRAARSEVVEHVAARGSADHRRVLDYWTPQRMAAALPIDMLDIVTKGGGLVSGLTGTAGLGVAPDLSGATTKVAPSRRHQSSRPQQQTAGSRWVTGGAVTRTTGRVFLTVARTDFVCSASTVRSANRDVVVTAGHCVKDGTGQWADNWTFVPGYREGGGQPYGQFPARRMFVAAPWSRAADDSYDVGMVALATSEGRHVAEVVGAQEISFDAPRGGRAFGFGYPADPPYNGEHLVYCAGPLRDDPHGETHDQGLGCDMTAGSSGGPWLSGFDLGTGRGTVTSVSSFKYSDDRRTMYGPYFSSSAKALFTAAERA
ncbi:trypsin-like serine peptidase [Nonomuraea cavernae]|uniref:trypsin-like serine peptidase n=1 Tax=Nonomuraea cavernae TaxID=2045107 RepID=UPI0033E66951